MADYLVPMLVCDRCLPGVAFAIIDGKCDTELTEGYCVGVPVSTALAMGWTEDEEYGHLCPPCTRAVEAERESDEGAEHGPIADLPKFLNPEEYAEAQRDQEQFEEYERNNS
jgi:hypothetical protein